VPFATVVTDLTTCHPTWFHPAATRLFVPTDIVRRAARRHGVPEDRIVVHGLPIRPAFSLGTQNKPALR
jgi:1,2-diacylglycerol 3-beta-galactosyltransferase